MEETDSQTFEDMRVQHLQPDGTNREGRPAYYKILESSDQRIKIQVTPVPDDTYTGRVEYIKSLEEIGPVTTPTMPKDYHDLISVLAAGKILQRSDDPKERARGQQLIAEARRDAVLGLVKDAHANRTKDITRPRRSVNEFI